MAEVNAKDLTTKTAPASTDSMLLFGTTTNEGAKITVDNLANNILERLATKTFPNQVGGSSAATILAQLATLNSNIMTPQNKSYDELTPYFPNGNMSYKVGRLVILSLKNLNNLPAGETTINISGFWRPVNASHSEYDFIAPAGGTTSSKFAVRIMLRNTGLVIYNYGPEISSLINFRAIIPYIWSGETSS